MLAIPLTQGNLGNCENKENTVTENEQTKHAELQSAMDKIQYLEEELNEVKAKVESLYKTVETKDTMIDLYKSRKEELELEALNKDATIQKYKRVNIKMEGEIEKMKKEPNEPTEKETKSKVKKLTDEIKDKDKKMADKEKSLLEMTKRVGEESNKRVEAENKMRTLEKTLENLSRIVELNRANKEADLTRPMQQEPMEVEGGRSREVRGQERRVVCRDLTKPGGGCTYGTACRYFHPEGVGREEQVKQVDCEHWMEGSCRYSDSRCKFIHAVEKKGTKLKGNRPDFTEALAMVKEVRDAVAGGALVKQAGGQINQGGNMNQQPIMQQPMMMTNQQQMMSNQPMHAQMMMPQPGIQHMNPMMQMNPMNQLIMTPMMMMQPGLQMQQPGWGGGQGIQPGRKQ